MFVCYLWFCLSFYVGVWRNIALRWAAWWNCPERLCTSSTYSNRVNDYLLFMIYYLLFIYFIVFDSFIFVYYLLFCLSFYVRVWKDNALIPPLWNQTSWTSSYKFYLFESCEWLFMMYDLIFIYLIILYLFIISHFVYRFTWECERIVRLLLHYEIILNLKLQVLFIRIVSMIICDLLFIYLIILYLFIIYYFVLSFYVGVWRNNALVTPSWNHPEPLVTSSIYSNREDGRFFVIYSSSLSIFFNNLCNLCWFICYFV